MESRGSYHESQNNAKVKNICQHVFENEVKALYEYYVDSNDMSRHWINYSI